MIDRGWLHDFALACRTTTFTQFKNTNNCILSTRLGVDVLKRYGLDAKAQPVIVAAFNREGYEMYARNVPPSQWPDDAWSVGVAGTGESDRDVRAWDGHLVVLLRNPPNAEGRKVRTLIDLTADQFDRPERGIYVGGPVFMDLTSTWTPHDPLFTTMGAGSPDDVRTVVLYKPQVNAGDWRSAPDWMGYPETHEDLVDTIVKVLDAKYPDGPRQD